MTVTIGDVVSAVGSSFPVEWAEPWDRVGLLAGDPTREVTGVVCALDPTRAAIAQAATTGANLLVTHHPAFLEPVSIVRPGPGPGGVLFDALDAGVALLNAHTNLDRAPRAGRLLPERLGLNCVGPVESRTQPMSLLTVFVPSESANAVTKAMIEAGAGGIGEYTGCSFATSGAGAFTPPEGGAPAVGVPGAASTAPEDRVELVCAPHLTAQVVAVARAVHPYEEPLIVVSEVAIARSVPRMGMLCETGYGTLGALAAAALEAFGVTPRVWGDTR